MTSGLATPKARATANTISASRAMMIWATMTSQSNLNLFKLKRKSEAFSLCECSSMRQQCLRPEQCGILGVIGHCYAQEMR